MTLLKKLKRTYLRCSKTTRKNQNQFRTCRLRRQSPLRLRDFLSPTWRTTLGKKYLLTSYWTMLKRQRDPPLQLLVGMGEPGFLNLGGMQLPLNPLEEELLELADGLHNNQMLQDL
jgi:hypothetical protein